MNRLLLIIFCIFFSSPCFSEWKFVYKQTNGYDVYVDFQSIKFHENFVFWSELVNFSESLTGMMSMTVKMKGDCKEVKQKTIKFDYFSKHFGVNFVKSSPSNGKKWVIVDKESISHKQLKEICGYKKN